MDANSQRFVQYTLTPPQGLDTSRSLNLPLAHERLELERQLLNLQLHRQEHERTAILDLLRQIDELERVFVGRRSL